MWSLRKVLLPLSLIIGLSLIFTGTFMLKGWSLAICLSVGGVLVLASWVKIALVAYSQQVVKQHEAGRIFEENKKLQKRQAALESEMCNIKDGRVKVLNIRPILELGLLEANCQIHKCFDEYYDKDDQPITVIKDETTGLVNEKAM